MKVSEKLAEALTYLSDKQVREGELAKDFIFDHEFAKKIFGEKCTSGYHNGAPDWKGRLQSLVMYTDEELSNFFINLYNWYKTIDRFKEHQIDFTKAYSDKCPYPGKGGAVEPYYNPYKYFIPLYEYLTLIGFELTYVYANESAFHGQHNINFEHDKLGFSIKIENNSFHDNWFTVNLYSKELENGRNNFKRGMESVDELRLLTSELIKDAVEYIFKEGGTKTKEEYTRVIREYKSYMIINEVDEFNSEEYIKDLSNE